MARNGSGVYSLPSAYEATPGETILATQHNTPLEDLANDANVARPIVAGGTGASSASAARDNLAVYSETEVNNLLAAKVAAVRLQQFDSSGTYTPDANLLFALLIVVGGGGAGGGTTGAVGWELGGSGGQSGALSISIKTAADIGASKAVTIGAGGAAASGATGNNGGTTSVGSLVTAPGGVGGGVDGGAPGFSTTVGTGDFTAPGAAGTPGDYINSNAGQARGGTGGASFFGGSARGAVSTSASAIGQNGSAGGGGGGGTSHNSTNDGTGGNGGNGRVLIIEFCRE